MNLLDACADERLFKPWFKSPASWHAWRAFHAALFGLPFEDGEAEQIYEQATGLIALPPAERPAVSEVWSVIGRRGGKSLNMGLLGVYLGAFTDYRKFLAPGERATIPILAADRRQARTIFRFVRGLLVNVPMLKRMVLRELRRPRSGAGRG
jgi:hypothetical protein